VVTLYVLNLHTDHQLLSNFCCGSRLVYMRVFTVRKTDILLWGFQWFARKRNTLRLLQRVVNWLSTFPVTNTNSLCVLVCRRPLTRYTCPSVRLSRVCATNWLCRYTIVLMYCLTGGRPALWRVAHSNTLAVRACVRCWGGPLSSQQSIYILPALVSDQMIHSVVSDMLRYSISDVD